MLLTAILAAANTIRATASTSATSTVGTTVHADWKARL